VPTTQSSFTNHHPQAAATRPVVVVVSGGPLSARAVRAVPEGAFIVAADGGLDCALAAGLAPQQLVGDLDSVSDSGRAWAEQHGVDVQQHSVDKDATDTELALNAAVAMGCDDLWLLAGVGDRVDHTIGTISALGVPGLHDVRSITMIWGDSVIRVAHPDRPLTLDASDGATFSLLALHGVCRGVSVRGARWELDDAEIAPGTSLGISNRFVADTVELAVAQGALTVVQS
jgi:thiamine pyrophosphokinase